MHFYISHFLLLSALFCSFSLLCSFQATSATFLLHSFFSILLPSILSNDFCLFLSSLLTHACFLSAADCSSYFLLLPSDHGMLSFSYLIHTFPHWQCLIMSAPFYSRLLMPTPAHVYSFLLFAAHASPCSSLLLFTPGCSYQRLLMLLLAAHTWSFPFLTDLLDHVCIRACSC